MKEESVNEIMQIVVALALRAASVRSLPTV